MDTPLSETCRPACFNWRFAALLVLAAAIPALGSLGAPFWNYDDRSMILDSPILQGQEPLSSVFYKPFFSHFAPLHETLIYAQWQLFGSHALAFRLVSLLLHFLAALACWRMLRRIAPEPVALGAATLWAVHPMQCESVDWIVEQKTLWHGLFAFLALHAYCFVTIEVTGANQPNSTADLHPSPPFSSVTKHYTDTTRSVRRRVLLASLFMLLSCLGKATGMIVAPLIVLYELLLSTENKPLMSRLPRALPFVALAVVFGKLALWANARLEGLSNWTLQDTLLNLPATLWLYLKITFLPWTASFFHELEPVRSFGSFRFFGAAGGLLALAAALLFLARPARRKLMLFALLSWCAAIGPMLNISIWTYPAFDRFQYAALPFLLLAVWLLIDGIGARLSGPENDTQAAPVWLKTGWAVAALGLAVFSLNRGVLFGSEFAVLRDAAEKSPANANSNAVLASTAIQLWADAGARGKPDEQKEILNVIMTSVDRASNCWNFKENYTTPAELLLQAAQIARFSNMPDLAEKYLERVLEEPRWSAQTSLQAEARATLAEIKIRRADLFLGAASAKNTPPEQAAKLCQAALVALEQSRELAAPSDAALFLAYAAHRQLGKLAEKSGDANKAQAHRLSAQTALQAISKDSPLHKKAKADFDADAPAPK
jgi:hypothetical protein